MNRLAPVLGLAVLLVATFGGAYLLVHKAQENALFADRITYSRHLAPPKAASGLETVLGYSAPEIRASGAPVPRSFLAALPPDLKDIQSTAEKKTPVYFRPSAAHFTDERVDRAGSCPPFIAGENT